MIRISLCKKGLVVAVILLFISVSVIPATASHSRGIGVDLMGGIGAIMIIENTGNETVDIPYWYMSVKGGHFGLINKSKKENVTLFEPGDKIVIRIFVFGFGFLTVCYSIMTSAGQYPQIQTGWEDMFVFGPYVYQRPRIVDSC